jgi:hypothetical protein
MLQIIFKTIVSIILCFVLIGICFFALKRIWNNELDPWGLIVNFLKSPSEKIPVVTNPIIVEPNKFHVNYGAGRICHFSIANTSEKKIHSIWVKIWSDHVPLSDIYAKISSEELSEFYSFKLSDNLPKFNYLAAILSGIDANNNYCRYIVISTLNSKQKIEFKIIADKNISKERKDGVDINLKYLAHSNDPPDIRITKNQFLIGTKVPEYFNLKGVSNYLNK